MLAGESLTGVERRRITKSGERIDVSISTATVADPDGDIEGVMTVVEDISERKERERMLRRQRDDLELMDRVTDIVLDITRELVDSSDQDRIEELVCTQLADAERYATTWIAESVGSPDELALRIGATESGAVIEDDEERIEMNIGHRVGIQAMESGEVQVREVPDEATGENEEPDTAAAEEVAAFPLSHRGSVYGVLVVQTLGGFSFREQELAGLATLGKTIGFARNAITNKKLLFADSVVDLRFTVDETAVPFVETTANLDCRAWLDGLVVSTTDDSVTVYLGIDETTPAKFVETVVDERDVSEAWVIADESNHKRVGVTLDDDASMGRLSHQEVTLHHIDIEAGSGDYGFEAPLSVDVSALVEDLQEWYPGIQLQAKREKDKPVTTAADVATTMESTLTDRQYEIFETAYYGGYFEWPRDSTIEELADSLDIAGSTFHHHLRHAQRKLATALVRREED
ncbi:Signal transduction histidine kinase with PAS domain [Halanaeroarchaeum sp. HSR-CO]|nr:Signal transduction histidine kinase with PAS domain [Halanaeroarchaeum sp. HSR-CO]